MLAAAAFKKHVRQRLSGVVFYWFLVFLNVTIRNTADESTASHARFRSNSRAHGVDQRNFKRRIHRVAKRETSALRRPLHVRAPASFGVLELGPENHDNGDGSMSIAGHQGGGRW